MINLRNSSTKVSSSSKRRKRILPNKTNIHTSTGIITLQGYKQEHEYNQIPGYMGISWELNGRVVAKTWQK